MESAITAIGIANPPHRQQQSVAAEIVANALQLSAAEKRLLKSVYRTTGIEHRYSVLADFCKQPGEYEIFPNDPTLPFPSTSTRMQLYKTHALDLALAAIQACFDNTKDFSPQSITHVITVSCTGMYAPGIDIEIVQTLRLSQQVKRTCINFMGCYGAFNALKVADTICKAEKDATVLIVCIELCTIHFQKNESLDNIISNAIFADGAGAVLVQKNPQLGKYFALETFYCDLLPQNSQDMTWHIADSGFDIVLSTYVPQAIEAGILAFTERLLKNNELSLSNIDLYAIHPGGYKILKACEAALGLVEAQNKYAYEVLRDYGNMSSATILFVLKKLWDALSVNEDQQRIFSCAFGPGLTLESMLLKVGHVV